jgi:hypothetical protein
LRGFFERVKRFFFGVAPGGTTRERLDSGAPAAVVFLFELNLKEIGFHSFPLMWMECLFFIQLGYHGHDFCQKGVRDELLLIALTVDSRFLRLTVATLRPYNKDRI